MAKRRGWAGTPPTDDTDARTRIIEAAVRCVDRLGADGFSLSEVAKELGVARPTVYRYFGSTEELLSAVGLRAMQDFSDQLRAHLQDISEPAAWVVEGIATPVEWLPTRPHMILLLTADHSRSFARGLTSSIAIDMTREAFDVSAIDWHALGFTRRDIDELINLMLRLIASLLIDPPDPPYTAAELRAFLRRWIAPALEQPRTRGRSRVTNPASSV
jgi:AcrR family transcriptional regulator